MTASWPCPARPPARGTAGLCPGGVQLRRVWGPAGALPPQPANCSVTSLSWLGDRHLQRESSAINLLPALGKGAGDSLFKHQSPHPRVTKGGRSPVLPGSSRKWMGSGGVGRGEEGGQRGSSQRAGECLVPSFPGEVRTQDGQQRCRTSLSPGQSAGQPLRNEKCREVQTRCLDLPARISHGRHTASLGTSSEAAPRTEAPLSHPKGQS